MNLIHNENLKTIGIFNDSFHPIMEVLNRYQKLIKRK
jgi:hypothetical protein